MNKNENYTKEQEALKEKYTKEGIPYVVLQWSESHVFPDEDRVYTLREFNELITKADSEFHNRKKYAEKKYGSYDNYWDMEEAGKLPPEDQGIRFGYDKTKFTIFNIPNPNNSEDTYSYGGDRYDIGDGNGSVFDFVRATCSYDEIITAMNKLEEDLYFSDVTEPQKEFIKKEASEISKELSSNLEKSMEKLDTAQADYRKVHESWLIDAREAARVEDAVDEVMDEIHADYDSSFADLFKRVMAEYPYAKSDSSIMNYVKNEAKKMAIEKLYEPSRQSQKAMNNGDYSSMNNFDWDTQRKIWSRFPANVNFDSYVADLFDKTEKEINSQSDYKKLEELKAVYGEEIDSLYEDAVEQDSSYPLGYAFDNFIDNVVKPQVNNEYTDSSKSETKVEFLEACGNGFESEVHYTYWEELARISDLAIKGEFENLTELKAYTERRLEAAYQYAKADAELLELKKKEDHSSDAFIKASNLFNDTQADYREICTHPIKDVVLETLYADSKTETIDTGKPVFVYEHEGYAAKICHGVKENKPEAIETMAQNLASKISEDCIIVPVPQHTGKAEYTLATAQRVKEIVEREGNHSVEIMDILECDPHDTMYEQKKALREEGKLLSEEQKAALNTGNLRMKESYVPKNEHGKKIYVLDNVVATGTTLNAVKKMIPEAEPLVFAMSKIYIQDNYHEATDLTTENKVQNAEILANDKILNNQDKELSAEDLKLCKKVIPPEQLDFTLELTKGEEGEFFRNKLREVAETVRRISTDSELLNKDGTHPLGFRYFRGNTEILVSELSSDGLVFGYNILGGDLQNSEWGYTSLREITGIEGMEMDYHVPENITIEQSLYNSHPEYFAEYAKVGEKEAGDYSNTKGNEMENNATTGSEKPKVDFYVADNIEFENESWSGLTAEKAVEKYTELKNRGPNGYIPCIGIDTHDGSIYDSGEGGHGQIIYSGSGMQTNVLDYISHFANMSEYRIAMNDLYNELKNKGYSFTAEDDRNMAKVMEGIETSDGKSEPKRPPMEIYTYAPFGYEGSLVAVETDLRRGIPAYDIVGIADAAVRETRERIRAAFNASGIDMPQERILQCLSPADLKKDSPLDLSMALSIMAQNTSFDADRVLALGELELNGRIRPVRGAMAAVTSARENGITKIVCDPVTAKLLSNVEGVSILAAENLSDAREKLLSKENFIANGKSHPSKDRNAVEFNEEYLKELKDAGIDINSQMEGHFDTVRSIEVAVAGKHNILTTGAPGSGKTLLSQNLIPILTPKLTEEEAQSQARIKSLAGIDYAGQDNKIPPFRMPHQTATIEGMCGGGPYCRPGEITLATHGTLFMDEAAEFRSSVIQMTRVPLEGKRITLSRAGRSTTYPADFQLALSMNPCPCGCYGTHDRLCLDSERAIDMYWKKISAPLLDRIEIKNFCEKNPEDKRMSTIETCYKKSTDYF